VPEPFLIVGLIAAIRRLLVLTAEFARFLEKGGGAFQGARLGGVAVASCDDNEADPQRGRC